ncbi:hypothetical protein C6T58_05875 [Burkholderia multivorans]|nr:hypothetical protein C6Q11_31885 [Burkholderia multivorans]PRG84008.1 hypothetical protein C6T58_05875 [Burkholderia multivorans]
MGLHATLPRKDKILSDAAIVVRSQRNAIPIFNAEEINPYLPEGALITQTIARRVLTFCDDALISSFASTQELIGTSIPHENWRFPPHWFRRNAT